MERQEKFLQKNLSMYTMHLQLHNWNRTVQIELIVVVEQFIYLLHNLIKHYIT